MDDFKSLPKMQCFKKGGSVAAFTKRDRKETDSADIAQDKKIVKKALAMHDKQEHEGEHTDLSKLRKGGRAKKETGTVKKYKTGGNVTNVYEAKKDAGDKDNIRKVKDIVPAKLCGGKSVKKYATGGSTTQPGATVSQQKFYDQNRAAAKKKEAAADYEAFGSRGDAARKGMEEGRMDALGNAYKKGGKAKKMMTGGTCS
jgi:hypothetical protein